MKSDWLETSIGNCIEVSNGKTKPSEKGSYSVFGSNGEIGKCKSTNAPENTIIIGRVGSYCGSVHFSQKKFVD